MSRELALQAEATGFIASLTHLEIGEEVDFDSWLEYGKKLQTVERSIMWLLADWARHGERKWGEYYTQAVEITGYSKQTLQNAVWVAERIPPEERRESLPFSFHAAVAALPPEERSELLDLAEGEGWTRAQLEEQVQIRKVKAEALRETGEEIDEELARLIADWSRARKVFMGFAEKHPQFAAYIRDCLEDIDYEVALGQKNPKELIIARFSRGAETYEQLATACGMSVRSVRHLVHEMCEEGTLALKRGGYPTHRVGADMDHIIKGPNYREDFD